MGATKIKEANREKNVIDFAFAGDSKYVLARLCEDQASFNHEYLILLAQALGVKVATTASKLEICRALEQYVGYESIFTDFHVVMKSAFNVLFHSVSAPRYINYVLTLVKLDSANPIFQYCAVVQKPQFKTLNAIAHRKYGRKSAKNVREELLALLSKYAVVLKATDMVAEGQTTSLKKFFVSKNPPYWISGDITLQAMARQLRGSLTALYKNLNTCLDLVAPDLRKEVAIDVQSVPAYSQIAYLF